MFYVSFGLCLNYDDLQFFYTTKNKCHELKGVELPFCVTFLAKPGCLFSSTYYKYYSPTFSVSISYNQQNIVKYSISTIMSINLV